MLTSRNLANLADSLGVENTASGESASEDSLRKIFSVASEVQCAVRFLRLGGPRQFRAEVISIVEDTGEALTPAYRMLLDENIPDIEFILTNPFSETFLTRMDAEEKGNWDIWRVRQQVLDFARGLIRAGQQRERRKLSKIRLAFHNTDLIWNLGIVERHCVITRAYYKSATGHDKNVTEIHLYPDSSSRLAESLISYYNSVRNDTQTDFVQTEDELKTIGAWPSLFKGNAVITPSDSSEKWIEKSCSTERGQKAETAWLSYKQVEAPNCIYFNPVKLGRTKHRNKPWRGQTSCIHRIKGVLATDILWHIQRIGDQFPGLVPKLEILSGSIIYQALQSLREFRITSKEIQSLREDLSIYPWSQKLENAIFEAGKIVIDNQRELSRCQGEARKLGEFLESHCSQPFRDAHLKNRIIEIDERLLVNDYREFREWLNQADDEEIFARLRRATHDIDFETSFWKVSEWDDPLHILLANNSGFSNAEELRNGFHLFKSWWASPSSPAEEKVMWMTLLCRSLREYCRRLWYDHKMPQSYQKRYGFEKRDHFLELALVAAEYVDGFTSIKIFLENCKLSGDSIWSHMRTRDFVESVTARFPSNIIKSADIELSQTDKPGAYTLVPADDSSKQGSHILTMSTQRLPQIFLSYAKEDLSLAQRLYADLKSHGINVWIDEKNLIPGRWKPQIAKAIARSRYFLICISAATIKKTGDKPSFQDEELQQAYEIAMAQDDRHFTILPVRLENCDHGDHRLSIYQQFDLFDNWEQAVALLATHLKK